MPVLYYLAGLTCTEETFTIKAGAQRLAAEHGLMLVAPDTSPRVRACRATMPAGTSASAPGFYVDATQAPWSRALPHVPLRDARTAGDRGRELSGRRPARQAIIGHSMGGHGALVCALRNPGSTGRCPRSHRSRTVALPVGHEGVQRVPRATIARHGRSYDASELVARQAFARPDPHRPGIVGHVPAPSSCGRRRSRPPRARPDRSSNCAGTRAMTTATSSSRASSRTTCDTTPRHCTRPEQPTPS